MKPIKKNATFLGFTALAISLCLVGHKFKGFEKQPEASIFNPPLLDFLPSLVWRVTNYPNSSMGTGFMLDLLGLNMLVTNAHVCEGELGAPRTLYLYNQKLGVELMAQPLMIDRQHDLCLTAPPYQIQKGKVKLISVPSILTLPFIYTEYRQKGDTYVSVGHPGGGPLKYSSFVDLGDRYHNDFPYWGAYCALVMEQDYVPEKSKRACNMEFNDMLLSKPCYSGQSGSPVFDVRGRLVSIIHAYDDGKCLAISAKYLFQDLKELVKVP